MILPTEDIVRAGSLLERMMGHVAIVTKISKPFNRYALEIEGEPKSAYCEFCIYDETWLVPYDEKSIIEEDELMSLLT